METNPLKRIADAIEQIAAVQMQILAIAMETRNVKKEMEKKLHAAMTAPLKEKE